MDLTGVLLALLSGSLAGFLLGLIFLPSKQELLVGPLVDHPTQILRSFYRRRGRLTNILLLGIPVLAMFFALVVAPLFFLRVVGHISPPAPLVAILALLAGAFVGYLVRSRLWQRYVSRLTTRSSGPPGSALG